MGLKGIERVDKVVKRDATTLECGIRALPRIKSKKDTEQIVFREAHQSIRDIVGILKSYRNFYLQKQISRKNVRAYNFVSR